jgi:hypothetical protein
MDYGLETQGQNQGSQISMRNQGVQQQWITQSREAVNAAVNAIEHIRNLPDVPDEIHGLAVKLTGDLYTLQRKVDRAASGQTGTPNFGFPSKGTSDRRFG